MANRVNVFERVKRMQFICDRIASGGSTCPSLQAAWNKENNDNVVIKTIQRDIYFMNDHGADIQFNHKTCEFQMENPGFELYKAFQEAGLRIPEPVKEETEKE